jgi:hypothetical protein
MKYYEKVKEKNYYEYIYPARSIPGSDVLYDYSYKGMQYIGNKLAGKNRNKRDKGTHSARTYVGMYKFLIAHC